MPNLVTDAEIDEALAYIETQDIRPACEFAEEVLCPPSSRIGLRLPWGMENKLTLRDSELTLWAGENGAGKSMMLGQVMAWILPNTRVLIASMEMTPPQTILRMIRQSCGEEPSREYKRKWLDWTGKDRESRLMIYDQMDTVPADKIVAMCRHAATTLQCRHIVIDSLTKCGLPKADGGDKQIEFVNRLQWVAKNTGAHIHLVAHMRKRDDRTKQPSRYDIRGASEISDLADNVVLMWRNLDKEAAKEADRNNRTLTPSQYESLSEPDTFFRVDKQRHYSWEGNVGMWWDPACDLYYTQAGRPTFPVSL